LDQSENILLTIVEFVYQHLYPKINIYLFAGMEFCKSQSEHIRGAAIFFVLALLNFIDISRSTSEYTNFQKIISDSFNDQSSIVKLKVTKGFSILTKIHKQLEI